MKVDLVLIGYINLFENITKTQVKDCFINKNNQLVFIVKQGQSRKAVGKKAVNLQRLQKLLNKKIKIIEFNDNPEEFVKNLIYPLKSPEIKLNSNQLTIKTDSTHLKALLLGRNRLNLKELQDTVKKYFNVEIKIN